MMGSDIEGVKQVETGFRKMGSQRKKQRGRALVVVKASPSKIGLDQNPITKAYYPPSRVSLEETGTDQTNPTF